MERWINVTMLISITSTLLALSTDNEGVRYFYDLISWFSVAVMGVLIVIDMDRRI